MAFRAAAAAADLWEGEMLGLVVDGRPVLLLRAGGTVRAYEDRCAHLGVPLSEGKLVDGVLVCRAHQYEYDATTGAGINPRVVCLRTFPVEERDGTIFVDVRPEVRR